MTFRRILGRRKLPAILFGAVCFLLAACSLLAAFAADPAKGREAAAFTTGSAAGDLVYIDPQYMSAEFASFTALESDRFYLMLSPDLDVYIVCVSDSALSQYQALQDYTYTEGAAAPEAPHVTGTCVEIGDELAPYAVEAINTLFGSDMVTEDTLRTVTGACYIDTTAQAPADHSSAFGILAAVIFTLLGCFFVYRRLAYARVSRSTLTAVTGLDEEFAQPDAQTFASAELFLTRGFLGGYSQGLRAVPLSRLRGVRGLLRGRRVLLCADDCDGMPHILCAVPRSAKSTAALGACVAALSARVPGLCYGSDRRVLTEAGDPAALDGFYAPDDKADLRVRERLDENGMPIRPNYALGILGALLGTALGMALWVGAGVAGYIIGLAGAAMVWFSLKGFQIFGGVLDRFGAVFSAALAALSVPFANYLVYVWSYYGAVGSSRYSFGRAFLDTWGAMRDSGSTGSYFKDLGLGMLFFVLAAWPLLKNAFSPAPQGYSGAAAGTPANRAAEAPADAATGTPADAATGTPADAATGTPADAATGTPADAAAGTPADDATGTPADAATGTPADAAAGTPADAATGTPADDGATRTLTHPKGLDLFAMVVALLGAVFFLFLGVMMILSGEEDTWELTLMCAAFAAAFAAGAWFARRSAKSVIEYDAEGVRLLRPGKPVVLRWDEVTGLRLDNPGRLAIIGAAGRIRFDLGWKGWQQLADYARAHVSGAPEQ